MQIKKQYQGELPNNRILNVESDSQTDTYSCDYLNPNIISAGISEDQTITASASEAHKIMLNNEICKVGDKLVIEGGSIKIGKNVKYVKASMTATLYHPTNAGKDIFAIIYKNNNPVYRITDVTSAYSRKGMTVSTGVIEVQEGDKIAFYLQINGSHSSGYSIARAYTHCTVEVVK